MSRFQVVVVMGKMVEGVDRQRMEYKEGLLVELIKVRKLNILKYVKKYTKLYSKDGWIFIKSPDQNKILRYV